MLYEVITDEAVADAVEELFAHTVLQRLDGHGNGGLGDVVFLGHLADMLVAHERDKEFELADGYVLV